VLYLNQCLNEEKRKSKRKKNMQNKNVQKETYLQYSLQHCPPMRMETKTHIARKMFAP